MDELWQMEIDAQIEEDIRIAEREYFKEQNSIENILSERRKTHGQFSSVATTSQMLKNVIRNSGANYDKLPMMEIEALENILQKISRIVNGDYTHKDSWEDIEGYARLISKDL